MGRRKKVYSLFTQRPNGRIDTLMDRVTVPLSQIQKLLDKCDHCTAHKL